MKNRSAIASAAVFGLLLVSLSFGCSQSESSSQKSPSPSQRSAPAPSSAPGTSPTAPDASEPRVPPFHATADQARPFPRTLPPEFFRRYPVVARAYRIAGEIPEVLAQQPCYCYCDRVGHGSLLDCWASDHGAG